MISAALASYNGEQYIEKQLQSILEQTVLIDEVIICDDGSTDNTVQIINSFIINHDLHSWKVVCNEKNLQYSKNFFKAISMCKGDYIFLADQDDVWSKQKVEKMLQVMQNDDEIYAVSSNYKTIDKNETVTGEVKMVDSVREIDVAETVGSSNIKGCTMCIRKELDRMIPHDDIEVGLQLGHDGYYNFLACLVGKNVMIPEYLTLYRVHENNISLKRNHRKTALAASKERRIAIFEEMISATELVLKRLEGRVSVEQEKINSAYQMLDFCKLRKNYVEGNIGRDLGILLQYRLYKIVGGSTKAGLHTMLSDYMYRKGINWTLWKKKRQ